MKYLGSISYVLLTVFGLKVFLGLRQIRVYRRYFVLILLLFLFYDTYDTSQRFLSEDRWMNMARTQLPENMLEMQSAVFENTNVNDVFLSTYELTFALNSLTGRKGLVSRRAHNSPYIDMDQRTADAAIILYGNNDSLRRDLLEKYSVNYLYWDHYWMNSEYSVDPDGQLKGVFDPMLVIDTPAYRQYLDSNGVNYFAQRTWIDPSVKGEDIVTYDLLFILPAKMDWQHPWTDGFDKYLESFWEYEKDGQVISRLYEIVDPTSS